MSITIKENNGVFSVEGSINTATYSVLKQHIESASEDSKKITLNIDSVKEIDKNGLALLQYFYLNSLRYNRDFSITGIGCREIYDEFRFENVA